MEFNKSNILTVVTADQAKVGSMGYFSNYIPALKECVTREYKQAKLTKVILDAIYPFFDGHIHYSLFYPAPEPTYAERQAEWIKENNVKVGTKVRFTKNFTYCEDGSGCCEHKCVKGMEGVVKCTKDDCLTVLVPYFGGWWNVPFTALEVIKKPTYRPFKNAEEFKPYRDEWFRVKNGGGFERVGFYDNTGVKDSIGNFITYQKLFEAGERENGEPCGIKE